ncbi:MAG: STN domain-containing protein, partial [Aquificaceae bacterium]|nr:STN domain-containing protein [Aquificaceae bacterium]
MKLRSLMTIIALFFFVALSGYAQSIREMRFENVKLDTVLKALSEVSGMNMVFDPAVSQELQKTVSVAIYKPVPVGEALNIILKTHGLIAVPADTKVYRITRAGELTFDTVNYTEAQLNELINLLKVRVSPSAEIVIDRT